MHYVLSDTAAGKVADLIGHAPPLTGATAPVQYDYPSFFRVDSWDTVTSTGVGTHQEKVAGTWTTVGGSSTVTLSTPNGETPTVGHRYRGTLHGFDSTNSRAIYIIQVGGSGGSEWDTYKVVSGDACEYELQRMVPDPEGGCGWVEADEDTITAHRLPSVAGVPKIDPGQFVLARPKEGVADEYEMTPWGCNRKNWDCGEVPGVSPPSYPTICVPTAGKIVIDTCEFEIEFTEYTKYGIKMSARDLIFDLKTQSVESCDEDWPADGGCAA